MVKPTITVNQLRVSHDDSSETVRGLFSPEVPKSSFAEVHMGLLIEPTHMEDEDEDQENVGR